MTALPLYWPPAHRPGRFGGTLLSGGTVAAAMRCDGFAFPGAGAHRHAISVPPDLSSGQPAIPDTGMLRARFRLTEREAEVALLLAQRRTNKEIARLLEVSPNTAHSHTQRVLQKLGVRCRRHVRSAITRPAAPQVVWRPPRYEPQTNRN